MAAKTSPVISVLWNVSKSEILALQMTVSASAYAGLFIKGFFAACDTNGACKVRIAKKLGVPVMELTCYDDTQSFMIDTSDVDALNAFFKADEQPSYSLEGRGQQMEFRICKANSIHEIAEA